MDCLYVHHLFPQLKSCLLVSYAHDSTLLKVIPTKDLRLSAAVEINADLCTLLLKGNVANER